MVQLFQWLVLRRYKSAPCAHYNSTLVRHKPFIQWQCSFQMKAVLPLDERFVMALCCFNDKSPPLWCFSKTGPGQPCNSFACTCTHQWTQWETITYRREFPTLWHHNRWSPLHDITTGVSNPWHHEGIPTWWHHEGIPTWWHHKRKSPLHDITSEDPHSMILGLYDIIRGNPHSFTSQQGIPTPYHEGIPFLWHHKGKFPHHDITRGDPCSIASHKHNITAQSLNPRDYSI